MSNDMLGQIVRKLVTLSVETHGVVIDLLSKFPDPEWLAATKRFLRKENPWPEEIKLWRRIDSNSIRVNLDATPYILRDGNKVEWDDTKFACDETSGWVTVERRDEYLYVGGKRVVLHIVEGQKTGSVQGSELRVQLQGQQTLHPNIINALYSENRHLIPRSWRVDEQGHPRFIYFWAVGYRRLNGYRYVRCLYWYDDKSVWSHTDKSLVDHWDAKSPAAVLAS